MKARCVAFSLLLASAMPAFAEALEVAAEDIMVPTDKPGIDIFVRNKHPAEMTHFSADQTLIFVHGATYPASTMFDIPLGGMSFMDKLAMQGFDVYAVDLPGYGKSSRPEQMNQPADINPPFETTADAVRHYGIVVDYVRQRRGVSKVDAMGWSWGTIIVAQFATEQPDKVNRLALYAPIWLAQQKPSGNKIDAYRTVTVEQARQRWFNGVPEDKTDTLIPPGWFDTWQKATWATDAIGNAQSPPVLRAPNGVVQEFEVHWRNGRPTYDPAKITMPTLLVRGEWDRDAPAYMSQTLFPLIVHAPWKQYVEIGEATHTLMLEKNRDQLFFAVEGFLTQPDPKF